MEEVKQKDLARAEILAILNKYSCLEGVNLWHTLKNDPTIASEVVEPVKYSTLLKVDIKPYVYYDYDYYDEELTLNLVFTGKETVEQLAYLEAYMKKGCSVTYTLNDGDHNCWQYLSQLVSGIQWFGAYGFLGLLYAIMTDFKPYENQKIFTYCDLKEYLLANKDILRAYAEKIETDLRLEDMGETAYFEELVELYREDRCEREEVYLDDEAMYCYEMHLTP